MELPKVKSKVVDYNPSFTIIYGRPKCGKSTLMASLEDNLIIDLEDGYKSLEVLKIQARSYNDLKEIRNLVIQKGIEDGCTRDNGKKPYKFITIDNATRLEEFCLSEAARLYRETPMGKAFGKIKTPDGKLIDDPNADVRTLPNGSGYTYTRMAVSNAIRMFKPLCNTLILIAHVKDKLINKDGQDMNEMAIDLAGKLGDILCGEADAIGFTYRTGNKTILSFKGGDNIIREARPLHLRNKEFTVIESDENGEIHVDMSQIFI